MNLKPNIIFKQKTDHMAFIKSHANTNLCRPDILELNPVFGCDFFCQYCGIYAQETDYFSDIYIFENFLDYFEKYLSDHKALLERRVFYFSAISDCFQNTLIDTDITLEVLKLLRKYNIKYFIVTKGKIPPEEVQKVLIDSRDLNQIIISNSMPDDTIRQKIEPNAATIKERFELGRFCVENDIFATVSFAPLLPVSNQEYIKAYVEKFIQIGINHFYMDFMRLTRQAIDKILTMLPQFKDELTTHYFDPGVERTSWHLKYRDLVVEKYRPKTAYMFHTFKSIRDFGCSISAEATFSICTPFTRADQLPRFNEKALKRGLSCIGARFNH